MIFLNVYLGFNTTSKTLKMFCFFSILDHHLFYKIFVFVFFVLTTKLVPYYVMAKTKCKLFPLYYCKP